MCGIFSGARYISQTYSNRLSADLQKQATAYIEDKNGNPLSDNLQLTLTELKKAMQNGNLKYQKLS